MSLEIFNDITYAIKHQFPAFYKEQGPEFVDFVEEYYRWMLQEGNILEESRDLFENNDIDTVAEELLKYYKNKYMFNLPDDILGNQRLFQKHILELYRSKGSDAGIKLLFRLLYNEDVEKYIPSYDIFKTSDNTWRQQHYLEVSNTEIFNTYNSKLIYGSTSGTQALVESCEKKIVNGKPVYLLIVSNITGTFFAGEQVYYDGIDVNNAANIVGSPVKLVITSSTAGFNIGDLVVEKDESYEKGLKAVVSDIRAAYGTINFELVSGGSFYSEDAIISITAGGNTTGSDASFVVGEIINMSPFTYTTDMILPYINVDLDASTYGFASHPSANASSLIINSIDTLSVNVGTIKSILVTNPGLNYDGPVNVSITDPYTATHGIVEANGSIGGQNAIVTGTADNGLGVAYELFIIDTGYGYGQVQSTTLMKVGTPSYEIDITMEYTGVGFSEGYYENTRSFLSDDKYLFDGHYYQNFSYVIKSSIPFSRYKDILENTVHPSGNIVYGEIEFNRNIPLTVKLYDSFIRQSEV